VLAACPRAPHQPGALEHLHVLRDGVERHVEGLGEVGYARDALRQPLDDLSARRVRERREGEIENRGRHIFNLWVECSNWPALVKRSEATQLVELRLDRSSGAVHEHFESGQNVFVEGELGDRVYILLSGRAEVVRRRPRAGGVAVEQVFATLGPGECFGEMALLGSAPRNATVRCVEPMTVLSIPKREFGLLAANIPGLRGSFEQVMARRGLPPS